MSKLHTFQLFFTALGGTIGAFLGGVDGLVYTLIAFIIADYITGFMCAIVEKRLSSEVGFRGIFKKVVILMIVGIANLIDVNVLTQGAVARTAVIFFYLSNEGVSILENAGALGLPIPKKLRSILEQLKEKDEDDAEDEILKEPAWEPDEEIYLDDCQSEEPIEEESDDL